MKWNNRKQKTKKKKSLLLRSIIIVVFFMLIVGAARSVNLVSILNSSPINLSSLNSSNILKPTTKTSLSIPVKYKGKFIIKDQKEAEEIQYGKALIINTSVYFGPKGKIKAISNGMNCQNCHLAAGTKLWGNNYFAVSSTYPKFSARSGTMESIAKRINDCFERSLNGKDLDSNSREMKAIIAYINWLGRGVKKGVVPEGLGVTKLGYLNRAANPENGAAVFNVKCVVCHGKDGEGLANLEHTGYIYPPLWGKNSYNDGAGIYRLSKLAGFVKSNMPFGITYQNPILSDEESWDIAAFISSQPRPHRNQKKDYKDLSQKPIDFSFGPYLDNFSENQHKYGPFGVMIKALKP